MSDPTEWRYLYGTRKVLFVGGRAVGDYYPAGGSADQGQGIYRVRLWPRYRLQGGAEQLVLTEDAAEAALLEMVERGKREGSDQ